MTVLPKEARQNQLHVEYFMDIEDYFEEIVLSKCFVSRSKVFGSNTLMSLIVGHGGLIGRRHASSLYTFRPRGFDSRRRHFVCVSESQLTLISDL